MDRPGIIVGTIILLSAFCCAKDEPIRLSTVTNTAEPSGVEVMKLFRQKIGSHGNLIKLVDNTDPSLGFLSTEDCMPRKATEPYVCFYTTHYVGGTTKTFMGGGIYVAKVAGAVQQWERSQRGPAWPEPQPHAY
jgi:hypothetical protein